MPKVNDIYSFINSIASYSLQESYDNSGKNVIFAEREVRTVLTALDITNEIFRPLRALDDSCTAVKLCVKGISAISAHTNFDSAVMNDILCKAIGLVPCDVITEENGASFGCICETETKITAAELAGLVKEKLGCAVVRYNTTDKALGRIAVCSGSGGSLLKDVLAKNCDAYITGDIKHDIFIDAHNAGLCVLDAGHFHTENIFCDYMKTRLSEAFPDITVRVSEQNRDVVSYEF